MEYAIDESILYKAERFADEPEIIDEDIFTEPRPATFLPKLTTPKATTKVAKPRKARFNTLQSIAEKLYTDLQGDRKAVISSLIDTHGMTKAGATTYFYNVKNKNGAS
jgi:hypothetical protein